MFNTTSTLENFLRGIYLRAFDTRIYAECDVAGTKFSILRESRRDVEAAMWKKAREEEQHKETEWEQYGKSLPAVGSVDSTM